MMEEMSITDITNLYEQTVKDFISIALKEIETVKASISISLKEIEITKNLELIEQWKEKNNISKLILSKDLLRDVNNAKDLRKEFFHDNNENILSQISRRLRRGQRGT